VISVTHFRAGDETFEAQAQRALDALSARPGFVRGSLGRSTDDDTAWVLVTEWANVGSYRRALGDYDVKLRATPLLGRAIDLPSSFESLVDVRGGRTTVSTSDKA
jgi:heme oxygenase (mycobilin-producing)